MKYKNNKIYYKIICKNDYHIKSETMLARKALKEMMSELKLQDDQIIVTETGKPFFKNINIKFNYSHSRNYILVALSSSELGVDIEEERVISDSVSNKYLNCVDQKDRLKYFVIKESYVKLLDNPEILYEDIDIDKIVFKKYIIETNKYIASIMYDGELKELIEI